MSPPCPVCGKPLAYTTADGREVVIPHPACQKKMEGRKRTSWVIERDPATNEPKRMIWRP